MVNYYPIDIEWLKEYLPEESTNLQGFGTSDGIKIILSIDHGRHHMSISRPDRIPSWDDIKEARDMFLPIVKHFVMALPPPQHYVNTHPYTMHLWECLPEREADLIWTFEQG